MLSETGFNLGRASEISRDELNFQKFIDRLRRKFSTIFYSILRVQLILKGIIKDQEWEQFSQDIRFDFLRDNFFTELKENEILAQSREKEDNQICREERTRSNKRARERKK